MRPRARVCAYTPFTPREHNTAATRAAVSSSGGARPNVSSLDKRKQNQAAIEFDKLMLRHTGRGNTHLITPAVAPCARRAHVIHYCALQRVVHHASERASERASEGTCFIPNPFRSIPVTIYGTTLVKRQQRSIFSRKYLQLAGAREAKPVAGITNDRSRRSRDVASDRGVARYLRATFSFDESLCASPTSYHSPIILRT